MKGRKQRILSCWLMICMIAMLVPAFGTTAGAAATCKQNGVSEYWYCPDCAEVNIPAYFSDADGINGFYEPPVILSYGAVDANHDGVCDDCGKNMPVFKQVTDEGQITAGGKYILVTEIGGRYFAMVAGNEQYGTDLPAVEITPAADGSVAFENAAQAMIFELQFAHACTQWGNRIRYGMITHFQNSMAMLEPAGDSFYFEEYSIRGSKYGYYVGLNAQGDANIHSAYSDFNYFQAYATAEGRIFSMKDYSADANGRQFDCTDVCIREIDSGWGRYTGNHKRECNRYRL